MTEPRHIVVGISHPSSDPTRHRVFEVRAMPNGPSGGWVASVEERNANAQPDRWLAWRPHGSRNRPFATAAACLGDAVEFIVSTLAREAADERDPAASSPPSMHIHDRSR